MNRRVLALLCLTVPLLFAGCETDPFCLGCDDGDASSDPDSGDGDGGAGDGDADSDGDSDADAGHDAGGDGGCVPTAPEICNGVDDNCNGEIDEDFDFDTDPRHCGRCENPCLLDHAFNVCIDGECAIEVCDVCYHDIDGNALNGCEYACCATTTTEVPGSCEAGEGAQVDCCDGLDNDCDGEFDEDHDTSNDPNNCGGCSATCEGLECPFRCDYFLGIAGCADGECYLADCIEGHYDINEDDSDGCEYACTPNPATSGTEVCNSRDDDCDGEVDEEFPGRGDICGSPVGACEEGTYVCERGHVVCDGEIEAEDEVCDGADNDCDGDIDEEDPRLGDACGTDRGICNRGIYECTDGELICAGEIAPGTETCNGLDDDCDGFVDDDVPDEGPCGTDEGACREGTRVCLGGTFVCDGSLGPVTEACNNIDDDCDGEIDEDLVRDCSGDCGPGEEICTLGSWGTCSARIPEPEECNGVDDDCDGLTDENASGSALTRACAVGTCAGVETCIGPFTWDSCTASATSEVCNGVDDDCDGDIDEDVRRSCSNECGVGEEICTAGSWGTCSARLPAVEVCDGIDNDCDGTLDEDDTGARMTRPCSFGTCSGVETCTAPFTWTGCTAVPVAEICNNADDDCDGENDEHVTRACSNICGSGEEVCTAGVWGTCSAPTPVAEVCDGLDNDCDGSIDEDETGATMTRPCSSGTCSGTETCTAPFTWTGCTAIPVAERCNNADDDCDGVVDEDVTRTCSNSCGTGEEVCSEGSWSTCSAPTPSPEICDGLDNDCDASIDEDAAGATMTRPCSFGTCSGVETCTAPFTWTGCTATPEVEICNNEDDDCDGEIDEDVTRACSSICGSGEEVCTAGVWGTCSAPTPSAEICDGLDNDCDGSIDEDDTGATMTRPCSSGTCTGTETCTGPFTWTGCTAVPEAETCNNTDDDCDGTVDEDVTRTCSNSCGTGEEICTAGSWGSCSAPIPSAEICDGIDNDCDGSIDEDDTGATMTRPCSSGMCTGTETCSAPFTWTGCTAVPEPETCNGVDDDCDGTADEDVTRPCSSICGTGEETCTAGSWGSCSAPTPSAEICDGLDNDCDGTADEDETGATMTRPCSSGTCMGTETCTAPFTWSACTAVPLAETCNAADDDCDGDVDEDLTRSCSSVCGTGEETCTAGSWGSCTAPLPSSEICDGLDNDCDGSIDEDESGATMTRPCSFGSCSGVESCTGPFTWTGCTATAEIEVCNNVDDDCDGHVDEDLSRGCSTICGPGEEVCTTGSWGTCSARTPNAEICDGLDNDCDGYVDEDASGATMTRPCSDGDCTGIETCTGPDTWTGCTAQTPEPEICDGEDNDCNGITDDVTGLDSDPINCGSCGNDCRTLYPNAVVSCVAGSCVQGPCAAGWHDLDPGEPGCEYECTVTGVETCDGLDNDCNGTVDDYTPPENYCGHFGVCATVDALCTDPDGAGPEPTQLVCNYPATFEADETLCDDLDNDCDGTIDEGYNVGVAYPCDNGLLGACFMSGHYECAPSQLGRTCILDDTPATPTDEVCNNRDDDCNGIADDGIDLANMLAVEVVADVDFDNDGDTLREEQGFTFSIFQFEASHPDASGVEQGANWTYACSNPDVLPWTGVSWRDAQEACCGLNPSGTCEYQEIRVDTSRYVWIPNGWGLCTANMWEVACQSHDDDGTDPGDAGSPFIYPYESDTYDWDACNGADVNPDQVAITGAMEDCIGGAPFASGDHYDMSGNVHEWTWTAWLVCACDRDTSCDSDCACDTDCSCTCDTDAAIRGHGSRCQWDSGASTVCECDPDCNTFYEYRGGSYNSAAEGMTCQFDFNVGADRSDAPAAGGNPDPGLALETLGFRCCHYETLP